MMTHHESEVIMRKGIGGHQSQKAKTETWLTPRFILDALGPFDLDPCSAPNPNLWPTAREHFTFPHQDGLTLPWSGRVWLNPPYGNALGRWMGKLAAHGTGTALIFARTETDAFFETVWREADAVMFLHGRLHFHTADGTRAKGNGGAPSVLVAYGAEDTERLLDSQLDGAFVPLKRPVMVHLAFRSEAKTAMSWRQVVLDVVERLGGEASLNDLYEALADHPKAAGNVNWRAKVRQTTQRMGLDRVERGRYAVAA